MTPMMKAVVFDGSTAPSVKEVPSPVPKPGEILLKILRAGICGSDLSILDGKHPRAKPGLILGHEIAARVVQFVGIIDEQETSSTIRELRKGSLVTIEPLISCGNCVACRTGVPHVCQNLGLYGIDAPGGMAEYMSVPADRVIPVPDKIEPRLAVLAEPLAVAVHAVRLSGIRYGDSVCVIGGGPIGTLIALVSRETTPGTVIISEPKPSRRAVLENLGFEVVDPASESLEKLIAERTKGRGTDITFECAGSSPAILSATNTLRPRGTLVQVSIPKEHREINVVDITFKELTMVGVRVYEPFDFERAFTFLCKKPELFAAFTSKPFSLDQAQDAFNAARGGDQGLRVIFNIGAE